MTRNELIEQSRSLRKAVAYMVCMENQTDNTDPPLYANRIVMISEALYSAVKTTEPLVYGYDRPEGTLLSYDSASSLYDVMATVRGEVYAAAQENECLNKIISNRNRKHYRPLDLNNPEKEEKRGFVEWNPTEEDWEKFQRIHGPLNEPEYVSDQELEEENEGWKDELLVSFAIQEEAEREQDQILTSLVLDLYELLWGVKDSTLNTLYKSKSNQASCHLDPNQSYELFWAVADSLQKLQQLQEKDQKWRNVLNLPDEF